MVLSVPRPEFPNERSQTAVQIAAVRLMASRDKVSGQCIFPRIRDQSPAAPRYEPIELSNEAKLYSFTIIHPNPKTGEKPFVVVYADFPEGARVFGRLNLPSNRPPCIGMTLRVEGLGTLESADGYVFAPTDEVIR